MKVSIFLLIVITSCILQPAEAQVNDSVGADSVVYTVVEQQAQYPGGLNGLVEFLEKNINYPERPRKLGISGTVFVSFIVNKDGSLSDIGIVKGVHVDLDKEAMRVLSISPNWIPGVQTGEIVRSRFVLPIKFRFPR
ncbi:MAG: energy transducer TonB [Chryseolinea sp.]